MAERGRQRRANETGDDTGPVHFEQVAMYEGDGAIGANRAYGNASGTTGGRVTRAEEPLPKEEQGQA